MALSTEEQQKIRRYMGYLGVGLAGSISLGVPSATQPQFILDNAMNRVLPETEPIIREYLIELECIDDQIKQARRTRIKVAKAGEIELRGQEEIDTLYEEYDNWVSRLSDILAAPINPFSELHKRIGGQSRVGVAR